MSMSPSTELASGPGVQQGDGCDSHTRIDIPLPQDEDKAKDPKLCVPLYKAAVKGDWGKAKTIINGDPNIVRASIEGSYTTLHVAVGAGRAHFVEEFVKMMVMDQPEELKNVLQMQDSNGNTALTFAAAGGSVEIAKIMIEKDPSLIHIRGGRGEQTPLYFAALAGHQKMALYLYSASSYSKEDLDAVFFASIKSGLYGLASTSLKENPDFAFKRDHDRNTAFHLLAQKPAVFASETAGIYTYMRVLRCGNSSPSRIDGNPAHLLLKDLLDIVENEDPESIRELLKSPNSHVLFDAVESGNSNLVVELIQAFPSLLWERDDQRLTIIHAAISHRDATTYNIIHEIGLFKDVIAAYNDTNKNNMLHLVAQSAPPSQLNKLSGAAFQMQRELLWFEEVKKIMQPSYIEMKNSEGKTPQELFTETHGTLLKEAETWMNGTAQSCMVVSTLIAGALFAAGTTVALGDNQYQGTSSPDYVLKRTSFRTFIISDAIAFLLALAATLTFLAILTSRYAERNFLKSLPLKLITGLTLLFFSIICMMVSFGMAFFIAYGRKDFLPILVTGCAVVPVLLYLFLQFSLLNDILDSTFSSKSLFIPRE